MQHDKSPSDWVALGDNYDCTGYIGSLDSGCDWPMYSYDRPAYIVWNAIAANLHKRGWNDAEIKEWLQSKCPRWALDGKLTEMLEAAANQYADNAISHNDGVNLGLFKARKVA